MNVFQIAFRSIRQRFVPSALTGLSVALGVMLMVAVLVTYSVVSNAFQQRSIDYDLVVGKQGGEYQLVLSTIYRLETPPAPIPFRYYQVLKNRPSLFYEGVPAPEAAVPIVMGDTTQEGNFPIVGTTHEYFTNNYAPERSFKLKGTGFTDSFDAIIGSQVAEQNGWDIGSTFQILHGGVNAHIHEEKFTVVGVLQRTGTANDRTAFVQLSGFYSIADHNDTTLVEAKRREQEFFGSDYDRIVAESEKFPDTDVSGSAIPTARKAVTAILVKYPRKMLTVPSTLSGIMKKGHRAQAVNPNSVMRQLMNLIVGNVAMAIVVMTVLVIIVSGIGIFVSIYNSMSDRRREIGIMRALGAQRQTVFSIIMAESILLCFGGGLIGVLFGHGLVFLGAPIVEAKTGLAVDPLTFHTAEFYLLPALLLLASLVGFVPALTAYRTDVSRALVE